MNLSVTAVELTVVGILYMVFIRVKIIEYKNM